MESINGLSKTLIAEKKTIGDALDAAAPAIKVLRGQHGELVEMLSALDKLGVVGTRVINEIKDDLVAELRHLEPVLRRFADADGEASSAPNCPGCGSLVPGLVAAAGYPFPVDAGDTIRGDFANVVFKMQIKLTPGQSGRSPADDAPGPRDVVPVNTVRPDLLFARRPDCPALRLAHVADMRRDAASGRPRRDPAGSHPTDHADPAGLPETPDVW